MRNVFVLLFILFLFIHCQKQEIDLFERPTWLNGKIFTELMDEEDLTEFAQMFMLTGFDTIVNRSGSYTVFAPTNEAVKQYLADNFYQSVQNIPIDEMRELVKYHIVQNPWSKNQLRMLDVYGWIDSTDVNNNKAKGFKRETLLRDNPIYYGIEFDEFGIMTIVDSTKSNWHRRVNADSRKYVPFFYKQYFDIYELSSSDYSFYFGRDFENNDDIYFASARIVSPEIFAENGFIYHIDKVVEPLRNANQILNSPGNGRSYEKFKNLLYRFPNLVYNEAKTFEQEGADQGLLVDSIFELYFPNLVFDIGNEHTTPGSSETGLPDNVTYRYHHGLVAPTDEAFNTFISDFIEGEGNWGSFNETPDYIKQIVARSYMSQNCIYPTDLAEGFINGENDRILISEGSIIHKEFGSNCSFIGVDEPIIPGAFRSITGPVYQKKDFFNTMMAVTFSGLLPALKREDQNYQFYIVPDSKLRLDSSLLYVESNNAFYVFLKNEGTKAEQYKLSNSDLRTLLMNHVATEKPQGIARKEFISTLASNHLIVNNITGEISGTLPSTEGFNGAEEVPNYPVRIDDGANNGETYKIANWFSFAIRNTYSYISATYPKFHALMKKAGYDNGNAYEYRFMDQYINYTIFVPTDSVIENSQLDTLSTEELQHFLKLHFLPGKLIFTDGKMASGYYMTDDATGSKKNQLYIETDYDRISILNKQNEKYIEIDESEKTNIILSKTLSNSEEVFRTTTTIGVLHEINTLLNKEVAKIK